MNVISLILEGDHDKAHALSLDTLMSLSLSSSPNFSGLLSGDSSEILCILHKAIRILAPSYAIWEGC